MQGWSLSSGCRGYPLELKQRALTRLADGEVSLRQAAREFNVSVPTLISRCREIRYAGCRILSGVAGRWSEDQSEFDRDGPGPERLCAGGVDMPHQLMQIKAHDRSIATGERSFIGFHPAAAQAEGLSMLNERLDTGATTFERLGDLRRRPLLQL